MQSKSILFRIAKTEKVGFMVQHDNMPYFYDRLHYHPEIQLTYIVQGTGDLFVDDSIVQFQPGNLFLIGSNQSHIFQSDEKYFQGNKDLISNSVSIFFQKESLGEAFLSNEEMTNLRTLIKRSGRGMLFSNMDAFKLGPKILGLLNNSGFNKFLDILYILNELAKSNDYKFLASVNSSQVLTEDENHKINKVINYILLNYKNDIKLDEIADIANYSNAAFCHFFKKRTRKTFTQFLREVRISKACNMLKNNDLSVSEICFETGFNNVSNFNRQFKKVTGLSPTAYLKKYKETIANEPNQMNS